LEKDSFDHKVRDSLQTIREAKEHLRLIDEELVALTNQHAALQVSDEMFKTSATDYSIPGSLMECNIAAGVKELAEGLRYQGLFTTFDVFGKVQNVECHRGVIVYRCIAELTEYIVRHSMATHVLIQLTFFNRSIDLYIEDDGVCLDLFDPYFEAFHQGLQQRINLIDGVLKSENGMTGGNIFNLIIPNKEPSN